MRFLETTRVAFAYRVKVQLCQVEYSDCFLKVASKDSNTDTQTRL